MSSVYALWLLPALLLPDEPKIDIRKAMERTSQVYASAAQGVSVRATVLQDGAAGEMRLAASNQVRVVHSETASLFEFRSTRYLWIAASQRALTWNPDSGRYFVTTEDGRDRKLIAGYIDHWYRRVWGRFANLSKLEAEFRQTGTENVRGGGRTIECAVVDVIPADPRETWRERLWIEPETGLIWRSSMTWPPRPGFLGSVHTIQFEEIRIGPPPADFAEFVPPRGSRRNKTLVRPPNVDADP